LSAEDPIPRHSLTWA